MKALILSGGKGTRLRPITYTGAKQLVPVANRPILEYVLENISNVGIKDVGIIISPETGEEIKLAIGDGSRWGVSIEYILQKKPGGLAHAALIAQEFINGEPFLMYLGDNLIGCDISGFIKSFNETNSDAVILLKKVENPSGFGIAKVDNIGRVVQVFEKPKNPVSDLAIVGIYIFSPAIYDAIRNIKPSLRGELEITDAIQELVNSGKIVDGHLLDTWWLDTGKKDDLLAANTVVLDEWTKLSVLGSVDKGSNISGRVTIEQGVVIKNSILRGPIVVGKGSIVENSFIGPFTSIGNSSTIKNSVIEHSVLLANTYVENIDRMEDSLVGRDTKISRCHQRHKALRLMLGDDSVVEV